MNSPSTTENDVDGLRTQLSSVHHHQVCSGVRDPNMPAHAKRKTLMIQDLKVSFNVYFTGQFENQGVTCDFA